MKTIWKYDIPLTDEFDMDLPEGAKILSVAMQYEKPRLWAVVDPDERLARRSFRVVGTGHPVPDGNLKPIGSFMLNHGDFVFHLFEVLK